MLLLVIISGPDHSVPVLARLSAGLRWVLFRYSRTESGLVLYSRPAHCRPARCWLCVCACARARSGTPSLLCNHVFSYKQRGRETGLDMFTVLSCSLGRNSSVRSFGRFWKTFIILQFLVQTVGQTFGPGCRSTLLESSTLSPEQAELGSSYSSGRVTIQK